MDRLTSAISRLAQRSASNSKSTAASTYDPDHQLRNQLLQYGLASLRKTFKDLDERQASRWHTSTGERDNSKSVGKTANLDILTEYLFERSQEPDMLQWNCVIGRLEDAHGDYETSPPIFEEFESAEEFQAFYASVKSDLELMRKIAEFNIASTSPAQQPSIDLSEVSGEVWERWKAAELDRASEEFKKAVEECKGVLGTASIGEGDTEASGRAALLTATQPETAKASTD